MPAKPVILPPLVQRPSPNFSTRGGTKPNLLVWHETAGSYNGAISWLCTPTVWNPDGSVKSGPGASAHIIVREDGLEATQIVHLADKSWNCCAYNTRSIGIEHANITAKGYATDYQLQVSARIFGWLCLKYSIPPKWSRDGTIAGVTRHGDLKVVGCNHPLCGPDLPGWERFLTLLGDEVARGGYRKDWAV